MNIIKKIYRKINKHFLINFVKTIDPLFNKIGIYLHPKFSELNEYDLLYAKYSRRYLINKKNKSFNKFFIDTSLSNTELCFLGKKYFFTGVPRTVWSFSAMPCPILRVFRKVISNMLQHFTTTRFPQKQKCC